MTAPKWACLHVMVAFASVPIVMRLRAKQSTKLLRRLVVHCLHRCLDDACGAQLSQEHNGMEFPIVFLSHTFTETQWKWSTTEQEAYGVYYAITKWNYYLQGADIIVRNDHKPLAWFLYGKNANNKVSRWSLDYATYNISFEWISGARNKAVDCFSRLVKPLATSVNMLTASSTDGPAFYTRSPHTKHLFKYYLNPTPRYNTSYFSGAHYCPKTTHSRLLGSLTANAEDRPIL